MSYLTKDEITEMGFKSVGDNVYLSSKASFYNCKNITIENNVRIDDFVVSPAGEGGIEIGSYIHIAVFSSVIGAGKVVLKDFSNISSRVSIYSSNDDYSGDFMTNPMVPSEFTNVDHGVVTIGNHVIVGAGSVVLPNVTLEDGVVIGALSLVTRSCEAFFVYAGTPAKKIKSRKRNLLEIENNFLTSIK